MVVANGHKPLQVHGLTPNPEMLDQIAAQRRANLTGPEELPLSRLMLAAPLGLALLGSALTMHLLFFNRAKRNLGF